MELEDAVDMFGKSLQYEKHNRELRARAIYWRGEAYYRLGKFEEARADYVTFYGHPGSLILNENTL
jgi:TolA-binding protein